VQLSSQPPALLLARDNDLPVKGADLGSSLSFLLSVWTNPYPDPPPPHELIQARARLRQVELVVERLQRAVESAVLRAPWE
jgi:hypothetical protein